MFNHANVMYGVWVLLTPTIDLNYKSILKHRIFEYLYTNSCMKKDGGKNENLTIQIKKMYFVIEIGFPIL